MDPLTYIARFRHAESCSESWQVMHRGMPVCAETDEATARAVYDRFRDDYVKVYPRSGEKPSERPPVWNGDAAEWERTD